MQPIDLTLILLGIVIGAVAALVGAQMFRRPPAPPVPPVIKMTRRDNSPDLTNWQVIVCLQWLDLPAHERMNAAEYLAWQVIGRRVGYSEERADQYQAIIDQAREKARAEF